VEVNLVFCSSFCRYDNQRLTFLKWFARYWFAHNSYAGLVWPGRVHRT